MTPSQLLRNALLALILLPLPASAAGFYWRAEATTLTSDDNSADTGTTATGGISISATAVKLGTTGLLTTNNADYYPFTVTAGDLCNEAEGEIAGWFQAKGATLPVNGNDFIVTCRSATSSEASISMGTAGEIRGQLVSSGGTALNLATTGCALALDTWYFIVFKWHIANDNRSIACYSDGGGFLVDEQVTNPTTSTADLATGAPGAFNEVRTGNQGTYAEAMWFDNIFISTTYGVGLENYAFITSYIPTYSTAPSNGTFAEDSLEFDYTPNQKGVSYGAACTNSQTIATGANVESGTCSGGAALGTGNDASLASVADSLTIGSLDSGTIHDVYMVHKSGLGGYSALASLPDRSTNSGTSVVHSFPDEDRLPDAGQAIQGLVSISATSPFDLDSYYTPDIAAGDVVEYDVKSPQSDDCDVIFGTAGDFTMSPAVAGGCDDKQSIPYSVQDYSNTTDGLLTAPAGVANFDTDDFICQLNEAAIDVSESDDLIIVLFEGEGMSDIDLAAQISDPDSPPNTAEVTVGTPPTGTTIDSEGLFSGTPTVEDEDGEDLEITFTDECGDSFAINRTVFVTDNSVTAPNCVGDTPVECIAELAAVREWVPDEDQLTATFAYSALVAVGDIVSQNPAAAAAMTAYDPLEVAVSLGPAPPAGGGKKRRHLGVGTGAGTK